MAIVRNGSAHWSGGLKEGKGRLSLQSGALKDRPYAFNTRFENEPGTNPEELIGAAHAACFSMALSASLEAAGFKDTEVETTARVKLEFLDAGPTVTGIELVLNAVVPGADEATFLKIANEAKAGCPISRALASVPITLTATLG